MSERQAMADFVKPALLVIDEVGRQDGTLDFNRIHDGTWWPHDGGDSLEWMRLWYPDYAGLYAQALAVQGEGRAPICVF